MLGPMPPTPHDLGAPSSYLVTMPGIAVIASDGSRVGTLEHVVADDALDIFEGIVVRGPDAEDPHRFVDRADIKDFYDRGVLLSIPPDAIPGLHRPMEDPSASDAAVPEHMHGRLRRAWDHISGK